ncbi:MAG: hypothetical protein ACR2QU_06395 [Gammaproteobacteria bacterium]
MKPQMADAATIRRDVSIDRVMAALPERVAAIVGRLFREAAVSAPELSRMVSDYLVSVEALARDVDYLDLGRANHIATICQRLIDTLKGPVEKEHERLVHVAVRYFVIDDDAESDTESLIGFDDDCLVAEVIAKELGVSIDA